MTQPYPHEKIEKNVALLIVGILLAISVGGLVQIVPLWYMKSTTVPVEGLAPYSALDLTGRDIYIREGCGVCHSQLVRPFRAETERYGHYSVAGEFVYDRPFLFGSRRVGPDLARVGGRYSDEWHREHLVAPRDLVPESIMPGFPWLEKARGGRLRPGGHPGEDAHAAHARLALHRRADRRCSGRSRRQDRARRADLLPAGPGHRRQGPEVSMNPVLMQNIFTLAAAAGFVGIVVWAWSRRAKADFTEAERIPFEEDLPAGGLTRSAK